jgi:hypothetical protein
MSSSSFGAGSRATRSPELPGRIALILASVFFSLVVLELGCRLVRSGPAALTHWPNLARERMSTSEDGGGSCEYAYDAVLGWTTPPNCDSPNYKVDADGFRLTPATTALSGPPVLATGSSFTLGEEVNDAESWPTYLQNAVGRKVLNGGVSGYSLDQTVLRTERLAPKVKPALIIAGFTPGDVPRTEMKIAWSRDKPYFEVVAGKLALRNVPVPGRPGAPVPLPIAARLLGRSALADELAKRLVIFDGWYYDDVRALPAGTGETVSCLLMPRLAKLGAPVMVLAQYSRGHWLADAAGKAHDLRVVRKVLDCAAAAGLATYDLSAPLEPAVKQFGLDALFVTDHHSAKGNRVVADLIREELIRQRLLPEAVDRQGKR